MDCSKTEVFLKEWNRMCCSFSFCQGCKFFETYLDKSCGKVARIAPDEAIKIVQEWSDAHPVKTRLSVLKEQYPKVALDDSLGIPFDVCAGTLYADGCVYKDYKRDCVKCWNTPIEGE